MKLNSVNLIITLLCAVVPEDSYRSEVYKAYISNRMELWKNTIDKMSATGNKSDEDILELINFQYGYAGYCIGYNKREEGKKYLILAEKYLEILENAGSSVSMVHAYKSAFLGLRITINRITAPVNGRKSLDHAKTAIELDSDNWLGYIMLGNSEFYMPKAFGGSKKEALDYYLKAKSILEGLSDGTKENWNYLQLMVVIAQTYTYLDEYSQAEDLIRQILILEPDFVYARDDLYPAFLRKKQQQ